MLEMLDGCIDEDAAGDLPRLAPVRELFRHVDESRRFHRALVRARRIDLLFNAGAVCLGRSIGHRVHALRPDLEATLELQAMARGWAGALFALLRWWIDLEDPPSPQRVDELYHAMVRPGVERFARTVPLR